MSIVKANTYQDASGGSNAVFSGVASPPNGMGFRSRIINGGMAVDQRNAGAAQTITAAAALAYTVDRWYAYSTGANVTGQRVAGAGANQYRYRFTGAASVTKIGFVQRIEALNSYDLNNISATLSVDLANSVLTTVTWVASYANTTDTFGSLASPTVTQIATGTFTVNSTVTGYSTTISIPSAATTGLQIEFSVGAQTSGTWTIGNVQLEAGTVASPFERRDYGRELAMCQRYYQYWGGTASFERIATGYATSATAMEVFVPRFSAVMRSTPSLSANSVSNFRASDASSSFTATAISISQASPNSCGIAVTVASGLTTNRPMSMDTNNTTSAHLGLSAEL